jgi:lactate permease
VKPGAGHINIFTSAGFFVLVTAFCCYPFRAKEANAAKDFVIASKRSASSVATLFVGSAMVYLMVDSGQIALLGKALSGGGTAVYAMLNPFLSFLGGMAFGQGLPGVFLFAQMQISVAPELGIPLILLVGIVTVVAMGPPNPLKPALIRYTASLANVNGRDSEIFRITLPWQLLQVVVTAIFSFILVMI